VKREILIGAAVLALSACSTSLTPKQPLSPDQRDSKLIVGSWIVAGDSPDYRPVPMHERFFEDGTYWIFWFSDSSCTDIVGETHLTWKIVDGVLLSTITKVSSTAYGHVGDVMTSKIISLTKDEMVLQSLDDGATYKRVRSTACLAPKQIKV
jgi:hypothetical protein